jgi:hypothetical protein
LFRAYVFFYSYLCAKIISFFIIFGDVRSSFTDFFMHLVILQGIRVTATAMQKKRAGQEVMEPKKVTRPFHREIHSPVRRSAPA